MTQSVQTSVFTHSRLYGKRYYPGNIYNVVINCEDGEYYEYEVEADTFAKATEGLIKTCDKALDDNYRRYNH